MESWFSSADSGSGSASGSASSSWGAPSSGFGGTGRSFGGSGAGGANMKKGVDALLSSGSLVDAMVRKEKEQQYVKNHGDDDDESDDDEGSFSDGSEGDEVDSDGEPIKRAKKDKKKDKKKAKKEKEAPAPRDPQKAKYGAFKTMQLSEELLRGVKRTGFTLPTPIQRKCIPLLLAGRDVVAMARTGSGKTGAFVIPIIERLGMHSERIGCRAVLISPTRELAEQTYQVCLALGKFTNLRVTLIVGGESMQEQFSDLAMNPDILVATPGRLLHMLNETELGLSSAEFVVFDEADRLFEMGFAEDVAEILRLCGQSNSRASGGSTARHQTALFSATMPKQLVEFARAGLKNPELVRLDSELVLPDSLQTQFLTVRREEKAAALLWLLEHGIIDGQNQTTIIFVSTRHHAEFLTLLLDSRGYRVGCVYGTMDQTARKIAVSKFRNNYYQLLVVTDVASRGIDIPFLDTVVNFDFPAKPKIFVHRCGRAARMGRSGMALSLVSPDELPFMIDLHMFLGYGNPKNRIPDGEVYHGKDSYYGSIPQEELDLVNASVKELFEAKVELKNLLRVAGNAYKLYTKTRAKPSSESVRRAKLLNVDPIHPIVFTFGKNMSAAELKAEQSIIEKQAAYKSELKTFRPPNTIFEIDRKRRSKNAETAELGQLPSQMMASKRLQHADVIQMERARKAKAKTSTVDSSWSAERHMKRAREGSDDEHQSDHDDVDMEEPTKPAIRELAPPKKKHRGTLAEDFRDQKYYISGTLDQPTTKQSYQDRGLSLDDNAMARDSALSDAVFDMGDAVDDTSSMKRAAQVRKWDRKKKKYVKIDAASGSTDYKKRKDEAGNAISKKARDAAQGKFYAEWKKKTNKDIGRLGEYENANVAKRRMEEKAELAKRGKKVWHTNPEQAGGRPVGSELLSADQIQKNRVKKAKQDERNKLRASGRKVRSTAGSNIPRPSLRNKGKAPSRSKVIIGGRAMNNRGGGRGGGGRGGGGRGGGGRGGGGRGGGRGGGGRGGRR